MPAVELDIVALPAVAPVDTLEAANAPSAIVPDVFVKSTSKVFWSGVTVALDEIVSVLVKAAKPIVMPTIPAINPIIAIIFIHCFPYYFFFIIKLKQNYITFEGLQMIQWNFHLLYSY